MIWAWWNYGEASGGSSLVGTTLNLIHVNGRIWMDTTTGKKYSVDIRTKGRSRELMQIEEV
jgi:hypothetical protein